MPSLPSTFLSQSHLVDVVHDSSCSQSQGSPTIKHIGPDRPRSATEQNRAECRTSWSYGLRPRYWYPYFQWISNDYTFISHISKNGMFSGRLEGNCQEFSEKTIYFLWDSMAFIGIQWPFQCHFWLIGDGWFTTTTHCSSSDEPLGEPRLNPTRRWDLDSVATRATAAKFEATQLGRWVTISCWIWPWRWWVCNSYDPRDFVLGTPDSPKLVRFWWETSFGPKNKPRIRFLVVQTTIFPSLENGMMIPSLAYMVQPTVADKICTLLSADYHGCLYQWLVYLMKYLISHLQPWYFTRQYWDFLMAQMPMTFRQSRARQGPWWRVKGDGCIELGKDTSNSRWCNSSSLTWGQAPEKDV